MSDALIDGKRYQAPDLTTSFRVAETRLNPHPVAQVFKIQGNEEQLVDSYQIAKRPHDELVRGLTNLVTRNGFTPA